MSLSRSSIVNNAALFGLEPTPTTSRSHKAAACSITSRCPLVIGSFDPMTNGHLDVIEHAAALCDRLVVGVGSNPNKAALFTIEERLKLIYDAAAPILAG